MNDHFYCSSCAVCWSIINTGQWIINHTILYRWQAQVKMIIWIFYVKTVDFQTILQVPHPTLIKCYSHCVIIFKSIFKIHSRFFTFVELNRIRLSLKLISSNNCDQKVFLFHFLRFCGVYIIPTEKGVWLAPFKGMQFFSLILNKS